MSPKNRFQKDWRRKNVLIMGLGLQGRGAGDARVFAQAGARVTVTDLKSEDQLALSLGKLHEYDIRYTLGRHEMSEFQGADLVIRNPDVPDSSPYLQSARDAGVPIKMDSSLFAAYCPLPIVGITGTRGKTTTTMMIADVLRKHTGAPVYLAGNIPGKATLELLEEISTPGGGSQGVVVLELSSWELQGWREDRLSPHIAVFTNFFADHLNRYDSMDEYFSDKLVITHFQTATDWVVLRRNDAWAVRAARQTTAQVRWVSAADIPAEIVLNIPGEHNRENAAAALAAAELVGVSRTDALATLSEFGGVHYRLETIAVIDEVDYINDAASTTPEAGIAALRAMSKPVILIAGGSSKKLNLKPFADEISSRNIRGVALLKGEGTNELLGYLGKNDVVLGVFDDLSEAVLRAREMAQPGDVVLLSPGCASFSMFTNEFERGDQFNLIVESWKDAPSHL